MSDTAAPPTVDGSTASVRPRRSCLGRIVRVVLLAALAIVALVALTFLFLTQTNPGRSIILEQVLRVANDGPIHGTLHAERLRGPLIGRAGLDAVTLRDIDGRTLVSLDSLDVDYRVLPLLSGIIAVREVRLDGLAVDLRVLEDGSLDILGLFPTDEEPEEPGELDLSIDRILLTNSRVVLRDARNQDARLVDARDIDLRASVAIRTDGSIQLDVHHLNTAVSVPGVLPDALGVRLGHTDVQILEDLIGFAIERLEVGATSISGVSGEIQLADSDDVPFAHAHVDVPVLVLYPAEVNALLDMELLLEPVTIELGIAGPASSLEVTLSATTDVDQRIDLGLTLDIAEPAVPGWRLWLSFARLQPHLWVAIEELAGIPVEADLSATLRAEGRGITPEDAHGRAVLDVGPSRVNEFAISSLFLAAGVENQRLLLDRLEIEALDMVLSVSGEAGLDGDIQLRTRLRIDDLASPLGLVPDAPAMVGALHVDLNAEGTVPIDPDAAPDTDDPVALALFWLEGLNFDLDARLSRWRMDDMRAERLRVTASGVPRERPELDLRVELRDANFDGFPVDRVDLSWTSRGFTGTLDVDAVADRGELEAGIQTRMTWDEGMLRGTLTRLQARGLGAQATLVEPAPWSVRLDDTFSPLSASASIPSLEALGARLSASGDWHRSGRINARLSLAELQLSRLSDVIDGFPDELSGEVDFEATASGTLREPDLSAEISMRDGRFGELRRLTLEADLTLSDHVAKFGLDLRSRGVSLTRLRGFLPLRLNLETGEWSMPSREPMSIRMQTDAVDLGILASVSEDLEALDIEGTLEGELDLEGTLRDPTGEGILRVSGLGLSVPLDETGENTWRIQPIDLEVAGVYGIGDHRGVNGAIRLWWPEDGDNSGTPLFESSIKLNADLRDLLEDPDLLDEWIEGLRGQISARLAPLSVQRLPESLREEIGIDDGSVEATLGWEGTLTTGHVSAEILVRELTIPGLPPIGASIILDIAEETTIYARAGHDGNEVLSLEVETADNYRDLLEGRIQLHEPIRARLLVPGFEVADLSPVFSVLDAEPGVLQGYIDIFGTLADPQLFGRLAIRELRLFDERESLLGVELRFEEQTMSVRALICDGAGDAVDLQAAVDVPVSVAELIDGAELPAVDTWALTAQVTIAETDLVALMPRALVAGLLEDVAGSIDASISVSGTVGDPQFDGHLHLKEAALAIIPLARSFDELSMEVAFSNEFIRVEELLVRDGSGSLTGEAEVALVDLFPAAMRIELTLDDFLLSDPTGAGVYHSGRVEVEGITRDDLLEIDVTLIESRIEVPDDAAGQANLGPVQLGVQLFFIGEDVDESQVGERNPRRLGEEEDFLVQDLNVDVRIRTRGRNEVRHSLATIEFTVNLDLELRADDITTSGNVTLPRGEIRVAGRRLDLERGRITFDGSGDEAFNPVLDIRAVHVLSSSIAANLEAPSGEQATITVVVSGTVKEPEISLQSDPAMSEEDIIFVLLTGRPRMDDSDADAQSQVLATAGSLALGLLSDRISGDIPIDTLRIEGDAQEGQAISRVEGGKYISENVYVSGTYIPGARDDENDFEIGLEWILIRFGNGSIRVHLRGGNAQKGSTEVLYNFVVP